MKQKDIVLIVVIAFVSGIVSFVASNQLFVRPSNRQLQAEIVDPINATFNNPDKKYFNSSSLDPAIQTQIGSDSNQDPFNGNSQ